jgi:hypothetical protein
MLVLYVCPRVLYSILRSPALRGVTSGPERSAVSGLRERIELIIALAWATLSLRNPLISANGRESLFVKIRVYSWIVAKSAKVVGNRIAPIRSIIPEQNDEHCTTMASACCGHEVLTH